MDVRGTGGSDKPPVGYDVPTLAADVAGVIQSLGAADAVIVGSGTGGEIAWAMAGLQPDRVRAVAALAAPHPLDTRGHPRAAVRPSALRRLAFVQLPSFPEQALMEGDLVVAAPARVGRRTRAGSTPRAETTYRSAARVPFAAHSQMEQLRWMVRSMPRPDGRRYHATLAGAHPAGPRPAGARRSRRAATRVARGPVQGHRGAGGLALPVRAAARRPGTTPRRRRRTASPTCSWPGCARSPRRSRP